MDIYTLRLLLLGFAVVVAAILIYNYVLPNQRGSRRDAKSRPRHLDDKAMGSLFDEPKDAGTTAPAVPTRPVLAARKPSLAAQLKSLFGSTSAAQPTTPEQTTTAKPAAAEPPAEPKVVYIKLQARAAASFSGETLLSLFERFDLVFGKMDIFHRMQEIAGSPKATFSVINGEEPGTLIPEQLRDSRTKCIMFYISLSDSHDPLTAFEEMLEVAHKFSSTLNATIYDDQGCFLSEQNVEYQRDLIRAFIYSKKMAALKQHAQPARS